MSAANGYLSAYVCKVGRRGGRQRDARPRSLAWAFAFLLCAVQFAAMFALADEAQASERRHGISIFGELKYPPDFQHFSYVNPDAPKGGKISMIGTAGLVTFDSLNGYIVKGDPAQGIGLTYEGIMVFDQLMVRAWDEPDAVYGLVAESVEVSDDRRAQTFYLRPEARFSDGSVLTADDVIYSYEALREHGTPSLSQPLKDVERAEAVDNHTVRFHLVANAPRNLHVFLAELPVFSKAFYADKKFEETTLVPPIGSGPYKIGALEAGKYITYIRRPDYWARDLPVSRGKYNFDELKFEYFRDRTVELEALKAGAFDLREEFTSRDWATAYKIDAVDQGRMLLVTLPDERPSGAQGFFINTRREKFKDVRVRRALDLVFDFEWTNQNLFYGLYTRTESYFENSAFKASGRPDEAELAVLEPFRDKLPESVFGDVYRPPVSDGSGQDRSLRRKAGALMRAAGYRSENGILVDAKGQPLKIEFLIFSPSFERVIAPYVKNLKLIGIEAEIRRVDPPQYQRRVKDFDFDITVSRLVLNATPGAEIRPFVGSAAADQIGSSNLAGIKDPVVDALIDKAVAAATREDLTVALKALDRVLRAGHYWVPHWYKAAHNIAFWNKFSWPDVKPRYSRGVIETWWFDQAKAAKLAR